PRLVRLIGHEETRLVLPIGKHVEEDARRDVQIQVLRDVHDQRSSSFSSRSFMRDSSLLRMWSVRSWSRLVGRPIAPHHIAFMRSLAAFMRITLVSIAPDGLRT